MCRDLDRLLRIADLEVDVAARLPEQRRFSIGCLGVGNGEPGPRAVSRNSMASRNSRAKMSGWSASSRHRASILSAARAARFEMNAFTTSRRDGWRTRVRPRTRRERTARRFLQPPHRARLDPHQSVRRGQGPAPQPSTTTADQSKPRACHPATRFEPSCPSNRMVPSAPGGAAGFAMTACMRRLQRLK